jgi:hypothetical protein
MGINPNAAELCLHDKQTGKLTQLAITGRFARPRCFGETDALVGRFTIRYAPGHLSEEKPWMVPIPGTTKLSRLEENLGAVSVELTADDLSHINQASPNIPVEGNRYPEHLEKMIGR